MSSNENDDPAEIGMRIRGANGQTANLFVVETYAGTDKFVVDSDGDVTVTGNFTLTGSLAYTGEMAITGDTAATITLKITGASGQSADLMVVEDNNGTDYFKIGATGNATLTGNLTQTGSQAVTGEVQITGDTAAAITAKVTGASGQTADLFVVEQNDGTDVFKVDKDGYITKQFDPDAASYIVWKSGSTYYAKNGATGAVEYSGSNAGTVIRNALAATYEFTQTWADYQDTPVMDFGEFGFVWWDGSTHHCYYAYDSYTKIGHATSADGVTWTADTANNPVMVVGPGTYDDSSVAVFLPWKEGGTWYALYRGDGTNICLATSADGLSWSKSVSNPVCTTTGCDDPAGIIKVGSTYYLYANTTGGNREINILTSTDLTTWTLAGDAPHFTGTRYCCAPIKYGSSYYLFVSRYLRHRVGGVIELWESPSPLFQRGNRKNLGVICYHATAMLDTPTIATTDITRSAFPSDILHFWYEKSATGYDADYPLWYSRQTDIAAALANTSTSPRGSVELRGDDVFEVAPASGDFAAIEVRYGAALRGGVIKLTDATATTVNAQIQVMDDSTVENVVLDGNKSAQGAYTHNGMLLEDDSTALNVAASDFLDNGITIGRGARAINCAAIANDEAGFYSTGGLLIGCHADRNYNYGLNGVDDVRVIGGSLSGASYGAYLSGISNRLLGVDIHDNTAYGLRTATGTSYRNVASQCSIWNNGTGGVFLQGTDNTVHGSEIFENSATSGYGVLLSGDRCSARMCNIHDNYQTSSRGQVGMDTGTGMIVRDCTLRRGARTMDYSVYVSSTATRPVISDNDLEKCDVGWIDADTAIVPRNAPIICDVWTDLAVGGTGVLAATAGTGATQTITTGITNPGHARNVRITTTNNAAPSGTVTITGRDRTGATTTESLVIVAGSTVTGSCAFASVSQVVIPAGVTAADTVAVTVGSKMGLSGDVLESYDFVRLTRNGASETPGTVDTTYNTLNLTAITGGDNFAAWYRRADNIKS